MGFEQPKSDVDIAREKLAGKTDEQLKLMVADPLDVITTVAPGEQSTWGALSSEEISALAQEELGKRSS